MDRYRVFAGGCLLGVAALSAPCNADPSCDEVLAALSAPRDIEPSTWLAAARTGRKCACSTANTLPPERGFRSVDLSGGAS